MVTIKGIVDQIAADQRVNSVVETDMLSGWTCQAISAAASFPFSRKDI